MGACRHTSATDCRKLVAPGLPSHTKTGMLAAMALAAADAGSEMESMCLHSMMGKLQQVTASAGSLVTT